MDKKEFIAEINQIVSRARVSQDEKTLDDYARDAVQHQQWGLEPPLRPLAVVRPSSTEHVSQILRAATQAAIPVVPYGGGTGVMGAAGSLREGIVLDMGSMDKILHVSLEDRSARVQPGITLAGLDSIVQVGQVFVGHDPWSQPVATIGGAISTNGVGYLAAKYGPMGRQVLALEAVLPTGEVVRTPALPQSVPAGLDLNRLFIGTEGIFGVITEATIRLYPEPEERRHYALEFDSFQQGFFVIQRLFSEGVQPAMVDFSEEDETDQGREPIQADGPGHAVLHLSLEGLSGEVDAQEVFVWEMVSAQGGRDLGPEVAQKFWQERHASGERYAEERHRGERHPWRDNNGRAFTYIHTAVPSSRVLELRYQAINLFQVAGLRVTECAIWGEPEMFSVIAVDPENRADARQRLQETSNAMVEMAVEMGGTVEYCHGVGLRLKHLFPKELGEGGAMLMRRLKAAIDPAGIMNPGKLLD